MIFLSSRFSNSEIPFTYRTSILETFLFKEPLFRRGAGRNSLISGSTVKAHKLEIMVCKGPLMKEKRPVTV